MKKTPDLIRELSESLEPAPRGFAARRVSAFFAATAAVCVLALRLLPIRPDFAGRAGDPLFLGESALWLAAALLAAALVYDGAVPGRWRPRRQLPALAALGVLLVVLLARMSPGGRTAELINEFNLERGWCGPLILAVGIVQAGLLFALARQGAPTRLRSTAAWAAVSAGCLGTFLMQFICFRENSLHVFVWHFTSIGLLVAAAAAAGRRALRW